MRILVTGGAGFLGSHLCDRLVGDGQEVVVLDDLSTGSEANLRALADHPRFSLLHGDVREPLEAAAFEGVEAIYHLACPASPIDYQRDPLGTARTAFLGTLEALDLAHRCGARLLLTSTSEIYGEPEVHPQPESYVGHVNPIGPRACYDEGKRMAETLCFDHARVHGTVVKVARLFNTYGPRMHNDGRVVSDFFAKARAGEPITIFGDGSQTRSFCYVSDMVEGLVRLMETPADFPGPVNLGNPEETTIVELASLIIALTGSASELRHAPPRQDDPTRRCPDITLARDELGWAPTVALREGLDRIWATMVTSL